MKQNFATLTVYVKICCNKKPTLFVLFVYWRADKVSEPQPFLSDVYLNNTSNIQIEERNNFQVLINFN